MTADIDPDRSLRATGADFAASFVRSFPMTGQDRQTLASWFDLAIDAGRRQARAAPPEDPWRYLMAADEKCGRLAVRPEFVAAVIERPDATEIIVDGHRIAIVEEAADALRTIGTGPWT